MSNVIQFLAALGSRAPMTAADFAATVGELEVDDAQRQALLDGNQDALNGLLGGREKMLCLIMNPGDEPVRKDDDESEEAPGEESPEQE